jgi:putative FmdB family regulatory protein
MPIYEYKCDNGHVFDVMQRMSEDPLSTCIKCDAPVRKVLHPVGISFKGSGFYSTDYSGKSKSEPAKSDATSSNGDSKKNGSADSSKKPDSSSSASKKD